MEISVTDFSDPIGASVFKFCLHLLDGKVYQIPHIEYELKAMESTLMLSSLSLCAHFFFFFFFGKKLYTGN